MRMGNSEKMKRAEALLKTKNLSGLLFVLAAALLAAALTELFFNREFLSGRGRGETVITDERTYFSESGRGPRIEVDEEYGEELLLRLGGEIKIKGSEFLYENSSKRLRIGLEFEDESEPIFVYDNDPVFLTEELIDLEDIKKEAKTPEGSLVALSIDIVEAPAGTKAEDTDFSGVFLDRAVMIEGPEINPVRALFVFCAVFAFLFMALFSRLLYEKPHLAFFVICSLSGLCLTAALPAGKVGNDEETHLQAVMDMASFPGEMHISTAVLNQLMVTDFNNPDAQPDNEYERESYHRLLDSACDYKEGERGPDFYTPVNRMPAYLASAAGVKAAKGLDMDWSSLIFMGRLANLIMYALIMTAAIRMLPFCKPLMMAIALFPQNIFLASTFSYDPFVTSCLYLGMACLLSELCSEDEHLNLRTQGIMALAFMGGCMVKAVYAPLVLIALLMPKDKFKKKKGLWLYRAWIVLILILLISSFILPTALAPAETGDTRGGATSEVSQVGFILSEPLSYAFILIRQMIRWIPQCFFGPDCTTFMGHIVSGNSEFKGFYPAVLLILLFSVFISSGKPEAKRLGIRERFWIFLMIGASAVLVWTSMYVAFTVPGAEEIAGVQGRYFIPLIFPLYMLFTGKRGILARGNYICYYLIMISETAVLFSSIWQCVVSAFCL